LKIQQLLERYIDDDKLALLRDETLQNRHIQYYLKGIAGSQLSLLAAALHTLGERPHLLVLNDKEEAAYVYNDLQKILPDNAALFYPGSYRRPYDVEETDNANILLRAEVLSHINSRKRAPIIVTYPDALFERVVTRKELKGNTLQIKTGDKIDIDFLNETLFEYQFNRVEYVIEPGQFSVRGGIVDVFSFAHDQPYRIEFFDDEVESIRTFDIESQLTTKRIARMQLVPNLENKAMLESRQSFMQYISGDTIVWLKSLSTAKEKLVKLFEKAEEAYAGLSRDIKHARPEALFLHATDLERELTQFAVLQFGSERAFGVTEELDFKSVPQRSFNKNFELLAETLQANTEKGITNILLCSSQQQIERFYSIFEDIGHDVHFQPILGALHEGFDDPLHKLACYTDHQIFERYQRFKLKEGFEKKQAITLKELNSLQYGDFVTHIDHGIGTFGGLQKIEVNGKIQEAIKLIYRDSDVLYISIHALHKIARFNSKDGKAPVLNKLGSPAWDNLKKKTKKKVKEIAYDLIKLYAKRKEASGYAYAPDSYLQYELEASFIYEDTPDQLKSTEDVKRDMESPIPMDRLICGDVGFGKTEVAIRAAFKAATDGKQIAVLVPTTILAFQHFKTFSRRLREFPVTVDYINRFKSAARQRETLKNLKEGKIDIIIGTHRLVSKDVEFKDLGLLIIDEEQKFGVGVKDKLKTLKVNIDTLTLTATPIPRTLQFSLMNARDLSVMNTPPPNRQPIDTRVVGFNEETMRDAIMYEVLRGGQVFFIHNRIENIHEVAGMIKRLCPDAKVGVGHGQMEGKRLEDIMLQFMEGEFDVLVSTTIIESGLDVPNANTIIINQAQNFGLSDLHQMRGRVGRSNKKAFCLLIAPPLGTLSDESRKRLRTLEQFSDLGSGFKIALRDLEIRGAGDMLGAEQSGFINDLGFDTYQRILAEAVQELKETEFKDLYRNEQQDGPAAFFVTECQLDTDMELLIPDDYVNNIEERLRLYQELDGLDTEEQLDAFGEALADRFGDLPLPVRELLKSMQLRWLAQRLGFEKIVLKQGKFIGYFISKQDSPYYQGAQFNRMLQFLKEFGTGAQMKQRNNRLRLVIEEINTIQQALQLLRPLYMQDAQSA
jgi:transcription-repair coupling factor (superfamily II helicase)